MEAAPTYTPHRDIMQYESKIWACADTLIACSIKQSDFPAYMTPFFALVMLEGRMLNKIAEIEANELRTFEIPIPHQRSKKK